MNKKTHDKNVAEVAEILYNNREDQLFRGEFGKFDGNVGNPNDLSDVHKQVFDNIFSNSGSERGGSRLSQREKEKNEEDIL